MVVVPFSYSNASFPLGECVPSFSMANDTNALGGVMQQGIADLDACKQACVDDVNCRGLDADYNNNRFACWLHFGSIGNTQSAQGVYHMALIDRCPGLAVILSLLPLSRNILG